MEFLFNISCRASSPKYQRKDTISPVALSIITFSNCTNLCNLAIEAQFKHVHPFTINIIYNNLATTKIFLSSV